MIVRKNPNKSGVISVQIRLKRRIEAHICIAFCAYKAYKKLDRQMKIVDKQNNIRCIANDCATNVIERECLKWEN